MLPLSCDCIKDESSLMFNSDEEHQLDSYETDLNELEHLGSELSQYQDSVIALDQYGLNPTSFSILKTTGLLTGTALEALAVESVGIHNGCDSETLIAIESLIDKAKEKTAEWAAKLITFFKEGPSKVIDHITDLYNRIKDKANTLKETLFSKANSAKLYVKAHPYKTVAMALAAAIIVIGIVTFTTRAIPTYKNASQLPAVLHKVDGMLDKVKWPFGKIVTTFNSAGTKMKIAIAGVTAVPAAMTVAHLGWSDLALSGAAGQASKLSTETTGVWPAFKRATVSVASTAYTMAKGIVQGGITGAKAGWYPIKQVQPSDLYNPIPPLLRLMVAGAGMTLGAFSVAVVSITYLIYQLIKGIVVGTLNLLHGTCVALGDASVSDENFI